MERTADFVSAAGGTDTRVRAVGDFWRLATLALCEVTRCPPAAIRRRITLRHETAIAACDALRRLPDDPGQAQHRRSESATRSVQLRLVAVQGVPDIDGDNGSAACKSVKKKQPALTPEQQPR